TRGFAPTGGDAIVTVRTSHFSTWSLGRPAYSLSGPLSPVAAAPAVNTVKAGSTVPVKFKLGGARGLDVLAGAPTSTAMACSATSKTSADKPATGGATSTLTYDAATQTYTYLWRTPATVGCRDLALK